MILCSDIAIESQVREGEVFNQKDRKTASRYQVRVKLLHEINMLEERFRGWHQLEKKGLEFRFKLR